MIHDVTARDRVVPETRWRQDENVAGPRWRSLTPEDGFDKLLFLLGRMEHVPSASSVSASFFAAFFMKAFHCDGALVERVPEEDLEGCVDGPEVLPRDGALLPFRFPAATSGAD